MQTLKIFAFVALGVSGSVTAQNTEPGFVALFNGKDLSGWRADAGASAFTVQDGAIVTHGPRNYLFYEGDFHGHTFQNFELMVDAMTDRGAKSGIFIDTESAVSGPLKGFGILVNNTYRKDLRRTGSIDGVKDHSDEIEPDGKWFTFDITVRANTITVKVDGKTIEEWTQPADWAGIPDFPGRKISPGTIALQAHSPGSVVHYRNIRIKPLE